jgi:hypothetical protein
MYPFNVIGTLKANFKTIYGAIRVRNGIINEIPGRKYTRINDQIDNTYGTKFSGCKSGLKNRISLYDSFSNSEFVETSLVSSFSHSEISLKIP